MDTITLNSFLLKSWIGCILIYINQGKIMTFKEAELTINSLLINFLTETSTNQEFLADLSEKNISKVNRAVEKSLKRLTKLQATLVKQIAAV